MYSHKQSVSLTLLWSAADSTLYFPDRHLWSFLSFKNPFPISFHPYMSWSHTFIFSPVPQEFPIICLFQHRLPLLLWSPNHSLFSQSPKNTLKYSTNLKHFYPLPSFPNPKIRLKKKKADCSLWCPSPAFKKHTIETSLVVQWLKKKKSCSVVSYSLWPHGLHSPWNSPGQNTGVVAFPFSRGIFPTQGWNPGLPHCRRILYQLSHKGIPQW